MRYSIILIASFLVYFISINSNLIAQDLAPTKDKALIEVLIVDKDEKPVMEKIVFISSKTGVAFNINTDKEGMAGILLPVNDRYKVNIGSKLEYGEIVIPNEEFLNLQYQFNYVFKPNETKLVLYIHNKEKTPLVEEIEIVNEKTGEVYKTTTNSLGQAEIIIPSNAAYIINLKDAPHYEDFILPDVDNLEYRVEITFNRILGKKLYPAKNKALIKFQYLDVNGIGVPDEKILIHSEISNLFFESTTNYLGYAEVLVPIGDVYHFSVKHWRDFQVDTIPNIPKLYERSIDLTFFSSIVYEQLEAERIELARLQDSLIQAKKKQSYLNSSEYIDDCKEELDSTTQEIRENINTDPQYFEKKRFNINSVLYRFRNKWKKKVIVTDVTCSMNPYLWEILQWHVLKLVADEKNQYVFFNDGNGKPNHMKKIGETGGFHYANVDNIDSLLNILYKAREYGCSGDTPENDLEALLEAKKYMGDNWELILVADNYSPVRDIELLEKLDMPVHVILCGQDVSVHEHYLEIAHKTKGSVHTIEEDIENLSKLNEGERIKVNGYTYLFTRGKFLLIE